jgi:hypothetical protein
MDYPRRFDTSIRVSLFLTPLTHSHTFPIIPSPTFPSTCLSPDQPGYGQVVANGATRRRMRRNNTTAASLGPSKNSTSQASWTVVTPTSALNNTSTSALAISTTTTTTITASHATPKFSRPVPAAPLFSNTTPSSSHYHTSPVDSHSHNQRLDSPHGYPIPTTSSRLITPSSSSTMAKNNPTESQSMRERSGSVYASARYAPYPGSSPSSYAATQRRTSLSGSGSGSSVSRRRSSASGTFDVSPSTRGTTLDPNADYPIILPPIQTPIHAQSAQHGSAGATSYSHYALPPISALEDLRGVNCSDSEAVLKRLKEEDDGIVGGSSVLSSFSGPPLSTGPGRRQAEEAGGEGMRRRSLSALVYNKYVPCVQSSLFLFNQSP